MQLVRYEDNTKEAIASIKFDHELAMCNDVCCQDPRYVNCVDRLYDNIVAALHDEAAETNKLHTDSLHQLSGWNEYCKDLHSVIRISFLTRRTRSSPQVSTLYENMWYKLKRANSKYVLRQCKKSTG